MRLRPYGRQAVLLETASTAHALALHEALTGRAGIRETVPAARTVLVAFDPASTDAWQIAALADAVADGGAGTPHGAEVLVDVRYDGPDLSRTAGELGMSSDELVRRHVDGHYVAGFCGFSPGFAYLTGLDPALHVARLATPRAEVPAGAVGIAGEFTGVYPRPSPGGWRLIGTTDVAVWDAERDPPALLAPGTAVRFRAA
jgi:KipI family sensor histidine kinase inhibitor